MQPTSFVQRMNETITTTIHHMPSPNNHEEYVVVEMKLIDWCHMSFKSTLSTDTSVLALKEMIRRRHVVVRGSATNVTICLHSFEERNELCQNNATLSDCGVRGHLNRDEAPTVMLYYNFKTDKSQIDPILLC